MVHKLEEGDKDEIKKLVVQAVCDHLSDTHYHSELSEAGITPVIHRDHHTTIESMRKDWRKIRTAFLLGFVTALTSGLGLLLWVGLQHQLKE